MAYLTSHVAEHRYAGLRAVMKDSGVDAVIVSSPEFFFFFTNYVLDVRPWERPVALVIPADGRPFVLMHELSTHGVAMAIDAGRMWVDDVRFYAEHPRVTHRVALRPQFAETVRDMLAEHGLARGTIGFDVPPADRALFEAVAPRISLRSLADDVISLRWVKTDEELALVRRAAEIADFGQDCYRRGLAAGRFIQELDDHVVAEISAEACQRMPGEDMFVRIHSERGPESAAPHGGPRTGNRIQPGDGIVNILVAQLNGVTVENERTWFIGLPTPQQEHCYQTILEAQEAAISQMVVGTPLCDVDAAACAVVEREGLGEHYLHRAGHGMGIAGPEWPADMAFSTRRLLAGEVYSAEPGLYVRGLGGFRHDDTVIVSESGPEVVTHSPKDIAAQTIANF